MSLLDELEKLVKSKQKINPQTLGMVSKNNKPTKKAEQYLTQALHYEQEAEKAQDIANKIRQKDIWRHHSLWLHIIHTHCTCGQSYSAPHGLLLRQTHRDNASARYIPLTTTEGLAGLPLLELHRQERIAACPTCKAHLIQGKEFEQPNQYNFPGF